MTEQKDHFKDEPSIFDDVMFLSDRTCCVCRKRGKQIHHIDGDNTNDDISNLCLLCYDCHEETQIKGGFSRKLSPGQIRLFRDEWYEFVKQMRSPHRKIKNDTDARLTKDTAETKWWLRRENMKKLIDKADNIRDLIIFYMLFYTKVSIDELARIKIKDVVFEKKEINIRDDRNISRKIKMNDLLEKILKRWLQAAVDKEKTVVLVGPSRIYQVLNNTAKRAGIDISPKK
jgi:integrase